MRVKKRMGKKTLMRIWKMKRLNQTKKKRLLVLKRTRMKQMLLSLNICPLCLILKKRKTDYFNQQSCE